MAVLFCALMIGGCGQKEVTIDLAPLRCPPLRGVDLKILRQAPKRPPAGDLTDTHLKKWVDDLENQIVGKGKAGDRVTRQYKRCRKSGVARS